MVPTVLLTNDDGPPSSKDSPYVFGLYLHLTRNLGWTVHVVLPSTQKSWIGKAYHIKEVTQGQYFYPREPDGKGELSPRSRPLKDGEIAEWILLDGTPATCANIAIHNLYPGKIDLVISGPNLGRNTSAAFALSSGTVGAAMSSSLSKVKAIALSYGTVLHPTPPTFFDPAHILGTKIIHHLWNNWGKDDGGLQNGEVDLYNVNIPLVEQLLHENGFEIRWTTIWRNSYGRLFKSIDSSAKAVAATASAAGPDALTSGAEPDDSVEAAEGNLIFSWAPHMEGLITPAKKDMPEGSDGFAIHEGCASVTPLRASFAEPAIVPTGLLQL